MTDLQINLLENELKELYHKLEMINDTIGEIQRKLITEISYGSRVEIIWKNGERTNEGRVVSEVRADGTMLVNRDGYKGTIRLGRNREGLTSHKLYNLSVGTYGLLEKQQWLLNEEIEKKKLEIQNLINNKDVTLKAIHEVVQLDSFKSWYIARNYVQTIPYSALVNAEDFLLKAYVNEFLKVTSKEIFPALVGADL